MNSELLKTLIEKSGMNYAELGKRAGISVPTVYCALKGDNLNLSTLEAISRALGVSPAVFFGTTVPMTDSDFKKENESLRAENAKLYKMISIERGQMIELLREKMS